MNGVERLLESFESFSLNEGGGGRAETDGNRAAYKYLEGCIINSFLCRPSHADQSYTLACILEHDAKHST